MTRLLVVDDDPRYRTLIRTLLEGTGLELIEADGGAVALRTLRDEGVDAVLCDLFMPGVDGIEVIQYLRRSAPNVRIIAMSGGAFGGALDLLSMAQHLGAVEVLHKPFTHEQLLDVITRTLQSGDGCVELGRLRQ